MAYLDDLPEPGGNYLVRHWRGALPLPIAYWVNGILLGLLVSFGAPFLIAYLHEAMDSLQASAILWFAFLPLFLAFWVWTQVGIWRSAGYHAERGGSEGWGVLARIMVAIGSAGLMLQVHGLTLQGIEFGSLAFGRDPIGNDARLALSADGRILMVAGNLTSGTADRFARALADAPQVAAVTLDSDGGRIFEGQRMAELVQARGLDTRVDSHCASACTFVLIAGRRRVAGPDAQIGFHQPSFPGMGAEDSRLMVEEMRRLYRQGGISDGFLDRVLRVAPQEMWYPAPRELIAARVITEAIAPEPIVEEIEIVE